MGRGRPSPVRGRESRPGDGRPRADRSSEGPPRSYWSPMRPPTSLPPRLGLDPARMRLPVSQEWRTIRDHVVTRVPLSTAEVDAMFAAGRFHDAQGPLPSDAPYVSGGAVWFHRDLPDEAPVPFGIEVVHRDEDVLVADKPHFLATIPRGRHVRETALVRLRDEHGLPDL